MSNKTLMVGLIAVLVIAIGGYMFPGVQTKVNTVVEKTLGNASSPGVQDGCETINEVRHCYYGQRMTANASSTCSFNLTNTASTTVSRAVAVITNSRGGTYSAAWGIGANASATTTNIGYFWDSNMFNNMVLVASTSLGDYTGGSGKNIGPAFVAGPNSFLNFKVGTTTHDVAGYCAAETIMAI